MQEFAEHTSSGWGQSVVLLADEEDDGSNEEEDGRQKVGEPETNILLGVDHADLTDERTGVDHEVEVEENPSVCDRRINNNTLTGLLESHDSHSSVLNLFSEERRDVGFEETGTDSERNKSNNERSQGDIWVGDDRWSSGGDQDDVSND